MTAGAGKMGGLIFRWGDRRYFRVWWRGYEYGDHQGGRIVWFWWGRPKRPRLTMGEMASLAAVGANKEFMSAILEHQRAEREAIGRVCGLSAKQLGSGTFTATEVMWKRRAIEPRPLSRQEYIRRFQRRPPPE